MKTNAAEYNRNALQRISRNALDANRGPVFSSSIFTDSSFRILSFEYIWIFQIFLPVAGDESLRLEGYKALSSLSVNKNMETYNVHECVMSRRKIQTSVIWKTFKNTLCGVHSRQGR